MHFLKNEFFPENISVALAEDWMWGTPAYPEEEQLLSQTASPKRLREFRAGRHCAHRVLETLGFKSFGLLRDKSGAPEWPPNICGSISHSGEHCIAIAALKTDYLSVAVDIERNRIIKDETLERISHVSERKQLLKVPEKLSGVNARAVLFSIKECIHKIYYPLNKHTLDFLDVEVKIDWETGFFSVLVVHPAENPVYPINELSGSFGCEKEYVYSHINFR